MGVNVVADLFAFVTKDLVFPAFEVALDEVGKETVQLDTGVVGPGEATTTQTTGRHAKVATVFLNHDISSHLGGSKE